MTAMGELWKYILGGGGMLFLGALGGAVKWIADGASRREDKVERQVKDWQRDTVNRATWEAKQHDWWRDYAGRLEYVITRHPELGPDALPDKRPYPKRPRNRDEDDADSRAVDR